MSDSDKIKLTVLPTGTMHADLTWLLINPVGFQNPAMDVTSGFRPRVRTR